MISVEPLLLDGKPFTAVTVKLPKTNFMSISNDRGYIMCGALDVQLLNEKLQDRKIIAARVVGVRTIDQLLEAPLESVTIEAENIGIAAGMTGRDALLKMA